MSAEVSAVAAVAKWLWAPILGILGWFVSDKFKTLSSNDKDLSEKVTDLERHLDRNYYDKEEITKHIVEPLSQDMKELKSELKIYTGMMVDIHQDMAILKYKLLEDDHNRD